MKNIIKIKILSILFMLCLAFPSFASMLSNISPDDPNPLEEFIDSIYSYEGTVVSINSEKTEFLLSVSCTKMDKWSSICTEVNPSRWQLWIRFLNFFRDPTHIKVSINNITEFKSYDINIPANFAGLKVNTFVGVKGNLVYKKWFIFNKREILADNIIIPQIQGWFGTLSSIENDIINLKSESGFNIKIYTTKNTQIVDRDDNKIYVKDLLVDNDILSVWGRRYKVEWKEDDLFVIEEVELIGEKIIFIGKVAEEGEQIETILGKPGKTILERGTIIPNIIGKLICKQGLVKIIVTEGTGSDLTQKFYCTNCGNNTCKSPETEYSCPQDCANLALSPGDEFNYNVAIDSESFSSAESVFYGNIKISNIKLTEVKFIKTNNTEFYENVGGVFKREVDISDLESYINDSYGPKSIIIEGVVLPSGNNEIGVDVRKIIMFTQ